MTHVCVTEARGHGHVLKVAAMLPEDYNENTIAMHKAQVSGLFRVLYQEWAQTFTQTVRMPRQF